MRLRQFDGNVAHSNDGDGLRVNGPKPDGTTEVTVNDPRAVPANPGSRELLAPDLHRRVLLGGVGQAQGQLEVPPARREG